MRSVEEFGAKAELATTWPVLLPLAVGIFSAWAVGHGMAHLTVWSLARSMNMPMVAGRRWYHHRVERKEDG